MYCKFLTNHRSPFPKETLGKLSAVDASFAGSTRHYIRLRELEMRYSASTAIFFIQIKVTSVF